MTYAYVDNANRIFGDNAAMDSHLVSTEFKIGDNGKLSVYGYFLDYDDLTALSTATYGASYSGKTSGSWKLLYDLEYATQSDTGDNPQEVDADYLSRRARNGLEGLHREGGLRGPRGKPGKRPLHHPPRDAPPSGTAGPTNSSRRRSWASRTVGCP